LTKSLNDPERALLETILRGGFCDRARKPVDDCAEVEALWSLVFGGPPSVHATLELLIGVLVDSLPLAPPYGVGLQPPEPAIGTGPDPAH
jgi:hypothetical protein